MKNLYIFSNYYYIDYQMFKKYKILSSKIFISINYPIKNGKTTPKTNFLNNMSCLLIL
jgi:hypothetical protein